MTNRINGTSPQSVPTTTTTTGPEKSAQTSTKISEKIAQVAENLVYTPMEDSWEQCDAGFDDFVGSRQSSLDDDVGDQSPICGEEFRPAWEYQLGSTTAPAQPESATAAGSAPFAIAENPAADALTDLIKNAAPQNLTSSALRTEFSIVIDRMSPAQRNAMIELAGNREAFGAHLESTLNLDSATVRPFLDELDARVVATAGARITAAAQPQLRAAMEGLESLNANTETRRVFLAGIATAAESRDDIVSALTDFGLTPSASDSIADHIDALRTDAGALNSFLEGDSGDSRLFRRGGFDQAERTLERQLGAMHSGLESLDRSMTRNEIRHDQFLTDPTVAHIRDQVLADMGAVTGPPGQENELGKLFGEFTERSEGSQRRERWAQTATMVAGSVGFTIATAGVGGVLAAAGGATVAGLQAAPGTAGATVDRRAAQGAVHTDMAHPQLVARAQQDERVAYALAAAGILLGAAPVDADVLKESVNAGMEVGSAVRDNYF